MTVETSRSNMFEHAMGRRVVSPNQVFESLHVSRLRVAVPYISALGAIDFRDEVYYSVLTPDQCVAFDEVLWHGQSVIMQLWIKEANQSSILYLPENLRLRRAIRGYLLFHRDDKEEGFVRERLVESTKVDLAFPATKFLGVGTELEYFDQGERVREDGWKGKLYMTRPVQKQAVVNGVAILESSIVRRYGREESVYRAKQIFDMFPPR